MIKNFIQYSFFYDNMLSLMIGGMSGKRVKEKYYCCQKFNNTSFFNFTFSNIFERKKYL